jgi:hypothetical protein
MIHITQPHYRINDPSQVQHFIVEYLFYFFKLWVPKMNIPKYSKIFYYFPSQKNYFFGKKKLFCGNFLTFSENNTNI